MAVSDSVQDVLYRTVLVPLDGSAAAAAALPVAAALAERFGAELQVLTVVEPGDAGDARTAIAESLAVYAMPDATPVHIAEEHDVVAAIRRRVAELERCLVCVSAHGHGRVAGALIGSVAADLLNQIDEPAVLVGPTLADELSFVRPRGPKLLEVPRLVACVDESRESQAVLPVATSWARALEMSVTVLTVVQPELDDGFAHRPDTPTPEAYVAGLVEQLRSETAVDGHVHRDPISVGEGVRDHLVHHPAALVAVATRARVGRQRLIHGSNAAQIIRDAIVPVLCVPQRA